MLVAISVYHVRKYGVVKRRVFCENPKIALKVSDLKRDFGSGLVGTRNKLAKRHDKRNNGKVTVKYFFLT